ncbi:uncharacterized protein LOC130744425 [Lotus japonicus]|uniref:uncharacterized protein LOC130744425 n=1 Tax=Lotus japonicus TaxID=34305 RepID=UPI00258DA06D|nr:uncharacterized protein LOC130744425 [Lotus japonicus]
MPQQQQFHQAVQPPANPPLEDLVRQNVSSIKNMETMLSQLATTVNQLQAQGSGKLPAQPQINPNSANTSNVSAITLRFGKTTNFPAGNDVVVEDDSDEDDSTTPDVTIHRVDSTSDALPDPNPEARFAVPPPFPQRAVKQKKMNMLEKEKNEIIEIFRKVEINIPLLEVIKQIPKYAKFLKDLCTHKRRLKETEKNCQNVSALIHQHQALPPKCKDPCTFSIPCTIGKFEFDDAMIDLGASINVMPLSVFKSLGLGPLKPTEVVIQLANRSSAYPKGLVEDVLVKVNTLIFPADFYILDMAERLQTMQVL